MHIINPGEPPSSGWDVPHLYVPMSAIFIAVYAWLNPYGITLTDKDLRWAAAEGVPESVTAATYLLNERSVGEIVARLTTRELEQVINIAGRSPQIYPPGAYASLKKNGTDGQCRGRPHAARMRASAWELLGCVRHASAGAKTCAW
jgi:hypothetical protein